MVCLGFKPKAAGCRRRQNHKTAIAATQIKKKISFALRNSIHVSWSELLLKPTTMYSIKR